MSNVHVITSFFEGATSNNMHARKSAEKRPDFPNGIVLLEIVLIVMTKTLFSVGQTIVIQNIRSVAVKYVF